MNIIKRLLESPEKSELAVLPVGQLFLLRSKLSPKANSECIYNDAVASVKENPSHNYTLSVTRAYEEGEEALKTEDDESEDEWQFVLDQSMQFHKKFHDGQVALLWNNEHGDLDEKFMFVVDDSVKSSEVDHFVETVYRCEYERKHGKSSTGASSASLRAEFEYNPDEEYITKGMQSLTLSQLKFDSDSEDEYEDALDYLPVRKFLGNLYMFSDGDTFKLYKSDVVVHMVDLDNYEFWLSVTKKDRVVLRIKVEPDANPVFDAANHGFIFEYLEDPYMIRFDTIDDMKKFQHLWTKCMWEGLNKRNWDELSDQERL